MDGKYNLQHASRPFWSSVPDACAFANDCSRGMPCSLKKTVVLTGKTRLTLQLYSVGHMDEMLRVSCILSVHSPELSWC